jgi:hypothetical protein
MYGILKYRYIGSRRFIPENRVTMWQTFSNRYWAYISTEKKCNMAPVTSGYNVANF